jgi:hypothetical protein
MLVGILGLDWHQMYLIHCDAFIFVHLCWLSDMVHMVGCTLNPKDMLEKLKLIHEVLSSHINLENCDQSFEYSSAVQELF